MNSIRNYTRVCKFLNFHKIKQCKHVMRSFRAVPIFLATFLNHYELNPKFNRVSKFLNFHKTKQYKHVMTSYDFYNLSEFAFEHLRDSRRTSAPLAKSFFFQTVFRNMIVPLPRSCSRSCSRRAPTVSFFLTQQIGTRFFLRARSRIICAGKQNVTNYRLKGLVRFRHKNRAEEGSHR